MSLLTPQQSAQTLQNDQECEGKEENLFYNLMKRVGTMGRYQIYCFIIWCLTAHIGGGLTLIASYIFYQDPYDCTKAPFQVDDCLDYVCSLPAGDRQHYVPEPTINSLANKFGDNRCGDELAVIILMKTIMYAGILLAIFLLAMFGGIIGKKIMITVNLLVTIIGLAVVIWSQSLVMGGIGLLLCTFGGMVNINVCYPYSVQIISEKYRMVVNMTISVFFSLGALSNVLWFYIFHDFQIVLTYFYGIPTILTTIALVLVLKQPPICMVTRATPQKAVKDLKFIATLNNKRNFDLTVDQMRQLQLTYKEGVVDQNKSQSGKRIFTVVDIFRFGSLRTKTLIMVIIDCTTNMVYFGPTLMIDQFNFSIYVSGLVILSSQLLAAIFSIFIINHVPRRMLGIITFSICAACSIALIFLWDQDQEETTDVKSNIIVLVFIFVIEFAITCEFDSFMVYINELYPTQVRMIGIGIVKTAGAVVLLFQSMIIQACIDSGFRIMIIFAGLSILSAVCSFILPETLGKDTPDVIDQLRRQLTVYLSQSRIDSKPRVTGLKRPKEHQYEGVHQRQM